MAFTTPVVGDLVMIAPPSSASPVGQGGLHVVVGVSGTSTVTVIPADQAPAGAGITLPFSRILWRYAAS